MDLPSKAVLNLLETKGVEHIYHANSVLTACQFLRNRSLLSRGTIERRGLFQTKQASDHVDKRFSLWYDVFTDSVDIHQRARTANVFGPVLFKLGLKGIGKMYRGKLWVTKSNPTKWDNLGTSARWFSSIDELKAGFSVGTFDQMIVFRHSGGELLLSKCLTGIVLDDPNHILTSPKETDFFSMAYGALRISMTEGRIDVPIERRICPDRCKCQTSYEQKDFLLKMFMPKVS